MTIEDLAQLRINEIIDEYGQSFGMSITRLEYLIENQNSPLGAIGYWSVSALAVIDYIKPFKRQKIKFGCDTFSYKLELDENLLTQEEYDVHQNLLSQRDMNIAHSDIIVHDIRKHGQLKDTPTDNNSAGKLHIILNDRDSMPQPNWLSTKKERDFFIKDKKTFIEWGNKVEEIEKILKVVTKIQTILYANRLHIKKVQRGVVIFGLTPS